MATDPPAFDPGQLDNIQWEGGEITDPELLPDLPDDLRALLQQRNGFQWFGGGFHVRGAVLEPEWHSLRAAWRGEGAFWRRYDAVQEDDIPFAEDCVGDQYLLREGTVHQLFAEDGEVEGLGVDLATFFGNAAANPVEALSLEPLIQFDKDNGRVLSPGELLRALPPFVAAESEGGAVKLTALPATEVHGFHADLAERLRDVPDGGTFEL